MTNRPTTTTALSANFQASNALPPILRMQHSALRRRTTPAVMRHRAEAAKSSASLRPPVPPTAQTVTGLSEPFFYFFAANLPPPSSLLPTRRSNYHRHHYCHRAAGTAQQSIRQQPLPVPVVRTATTENDAASPIHREADAKCRRKKGGIGRKHTHFFVISRNFFEQVPVHSPMHPDNAHDQSAPQRLCGRKHHPPSRFLPSDLHLCPFLPIFAPIHVRKTSHPPSSSGLGLDSSPRPAAAIGGENLSLP